MSEKSRFFDGKTAEPYELDVIISSEKLIGKVLWGEAFFEWKLNDIRVVKEAENGRAAIITNQTDNAARLYLKESVLQKLEPLLGKEAQPVLKVGTSVKLICVLLLCAVLLVFLVFQAVPRFAPYISQKFPPEWEEALGNYLFNRFVGEKQICNAVDGLQALAQILFALKLPENAAPEVTVVADASINAFAVSGGKIILYSGLIEKAATPAEVAGVIAHEMGHVLQKHPTEGLFRSLGLSLIVQLMFGNIGSIGDIGIVGQTLFELSYSRNAEIEADKIAYIILENSNLGTKGLKDFFDGMQEEEENSNWNLFPYLSTHPKTSERIDIIPDKEKNRVHKSVISEDEWEALQSICSDSVSLLQS